MAKGKFRGARRYSGKAERQRSGQTRMSTPTIVGEIPLAEASPTKWGSLGGFEEQAGFVAPAKFAVGAEGDGGGFHHGGEDFGADVGVIDQEDEARVAVAVDRELRDGHADEGAVLDQPAVALGDGA